ncbi:MULTISPECIES: L,D-transpeptidase family protein [Methylobacterium]|uniref:L,D-transpeptidase family protein n=1 Tax=Methylobacterium TaxID=407 RepID=UPI0013EB5584|nr:L,D-transpeptidase family protein [Methylobacterium sp. DB0501]NGM33111.1 L,D-transpeptidase family protein [Methylobacterium sp. DB0501]
MVLRVAFPCLPSAAAFAWVLGTGLAAAVEPGGPLPPAPVPNQTSQAQAGQGPTGQGQTGQGQMGQAQGGQAQAQAQAAPVPPAPVEPARRETTTAPEPLPHGATPLAVGPIQPGAAPKAGESRSLEARPNEAKAADGKPADGKPAPKKVSRELPPLVVARISQDTTPTLTPATFLDTLRAAERYQVLVEAGGWQPLPADLTLKPGERNPAVPLLRRHLVLTEDLAPGGPETDLLDPGLMAALKRFQARHNLAETGLVGRQTLAALNVPASVRQRQLAASANRLIGSSFPFGERYVVVNIPSAAVEAVDHGSVARRYVAVVGKPERASPSVETKITNINFNPTWTVPVSLIKKDIIPHMRKDPGYLAKMHIRMLDGQGQEVQPTAVDWSTERAVNYTLRQDPGFDNSLGQVRIDMPNRHAVYMHDTPSKSLFSRDVRFHSSGCVRVADVKALVGWLLDGTPGPNGPGSTWGPMEIETGIATGERRDIKLAKPIPVTFVYLTGYATPDGRVHFRDDVYGLDSGKETGKDVAKSLDKSLDKSSAKSWAKPAAEPAVTGALARPVPAKPTVTKPALPKPSAVKPMDSVKAAPAMPVTGQGVGADAKADAKPAAKATPKPAARPAPAQAAPTAPSAERRAAAPPT